MDGWMDGWTDGRKSGGIIALIIRNLRRGWRGLEGVEDAALKRGPGVPDLWWKTLWGLITSCPFRRLRHLREQISQERLMECH